VLGSTKGIKQIFGQKGGELELRLVNKVLVVFVKDNLECLQRVRNVTSINRSPRITEDLIDLTGDGHKLFDAIHGPGCAQEGG
jgi:hypothetical protein